MRVRRDGDHERGLEHERKRGRRGGGAGEGRGHNGNGGGGHVRALCGAGAVGRRHAAARPRAAPLRRLAVATIPVESQCPCPRRLVFTRARKRTTWHLVLDWRKNKKTTFAVVRCGLTYTLRCCGS